MSERAAARDDFERMTRWLVRIDGFDHGPFSPEEIRERIRDGRLTLRSDLCEERERVWRYLEEVQPFRDFCAQLVEEARLRAREEELGKMETQARRSRFAWHGAPVILIGIVLGAVGLAFYLTAKPNVQPSNYGAAIFYQAELGRIEPWAQFTGEREHEWRFGSAAPVGASTKKPKRAKRNAALGSDEVYEDRSTTSVDQSFDFGADESAAPPLSDDTINSTIVPQAQRALQRCLVEENARRSGVTSAKFRFALLPTGRVAGAKVTGAMTGKMHYCTSSALRRIRVAPFSGGTRWIDLSLRIVVQ